MKQTETPPGDLGCFVTQLASSVTTEGVSAGGPVSQNLTTGFRYDVMLNWAWRRLKEKGSSRSQKEGL